MIIPLKGYVLISPIEDDQKSAGGIYLPESAQDKPCKGFVIEISNELKCPVKRGDKVIFKKWVNQEVEDEGKKYLLVKFDELLGIIT